MNDLQSKQFRTGTSLGIIPGTVAFVFLGAGIQKCSCDKRPLWLQISIFITIGVTAVVTLILTIWARRAINKYEQELLENEEKKPLLQNESINT